MREHLLPESNYKYKENTLRYNCSVCLCTWELKDSEPYYWQSSCGGAKSESKIYDTYKKALVSMLNDIVEFQFTCFEQHYPEVVN